MLRESIEASGAAIDLEGLTDPACKEIVGIPHSGALLQFADAFMAGDTGALVAARENLVKTMSPLAMVDAAGVMSNFQRMVRIADGTGIPSDDILAVMQEDLCEKLGINEYCSAANTKRVPWLKRVLIKLVAIRKFRQVIKEQSR